MATTEDETAVESEGKRQADALNAVRPGEPAVAIRLAQEQSRRELALEQERTRQMRVRYVTGAALVPLIGALAGGFKLWLEEERAEAESHQAQQQFEHETMWRTLESFDNPVRKIPALKYLAQGDSGALLTKWALAELEDVNHVTAAEAIRQAEVLELRQKELKSKETKLAELQTAATVDAEALARAGEEAEAARKAVEDARSAKEASERLETEVATLVEPVITPQSVPAPEGPPPDGQVKIRIDCERRGRFRDVRLSLDAPPDVIGDIEHVKYQLLKWSETSSDPSDGFATGLTMRHCRSASAVVSIIRKGGTTVVREPVCPSRAWQDCKAAQ